MAKKFPEIMGAWKAESEATWTAHYKKRFYCEFEDWKWPISFLLKLGHRDWNIEHVNDLEEVRKYFVCRLTVWHQFADQPDLSTFDNISKHERFQTHDRVKFLQKNFPKGQQMIALRYKDRVIIIDGHHRCVALCQGLTSDENSEIDIRLAVTDFDDSEKEFFDKIWRGDLDLRVLRTLLNVIGPIRSQILHFIKHFS